MFPVFRSRLEFMHFLKSLHSFAFDTSLPGGPIFSKAIFFYDNNKILQKVFGLKSGRAENLLLYK